MSKTYFVYILASGRHGTLYVGVTNSLERRLAEHRQEINPGFTSRYGVKRLVYFEETNDVKVAIHREKRLKKWTRQWKIELIEKANPGWRDLSQGWPVDCPVKPGNDNGADNDNGAGNDRATRP
jgi:putative endonuclease